MSRIPNPVRLLVLWVGLALSRVDLIDGQHARRITDLAWPRVLTGIARMSKNAVDVAMVGVAVGSAAIAGVGFVVGGGVASGTIALVSQSYGADATDELGQAVRSSVLLVVVFTLPLVAVFWRFSADLIGLISNDPEAIASPGPTWGSPP